MSLIILQVIPSLIGYIIIVLNFNCATGSCFPEHKLRRWANLTIDLPRHITSPWTTNLISSLCPTRGSNKPFVFIIPLTWCHRRSITSSWKPLDKFVVIIVNNLTSSKLCVEIQDEKYHPCPSMNCVIIDNILASPQHKLVHILCCILISLLSNLCYVLPWSITIFDVKNVVSITQPLKNSWYMWYFLPYPFIPWSPCCF